MPSSMLILDSERVVWRLVCGAEGSQERKPLEPMSWKPQRPSKTRHLGRQLKTKQDLAGQTLAMVVGPRKPVRLGCNLEI